MIKRLSPAEASQRIADVARMSRAERNDLRALIRAAGLDPTTDFRFENWSGSDFSGQDLSRLDFTGARLHGCNFKGAILSRETEFRKRGNGTVEYMEGYTRLDQAELGRVIHRPGRDPNLPAETTAIANPREALDWAEYCRAWVQPEKPIPDAHLPVGAIFQDAPFGPEMVVVPPGTFKMGWPDGAWSKVEHPQYEVTIAETFAVGRFAITFEEWDFAQDHPDWQKQSGLVPRRPDDQKWGRGRRPVIDVSLEDAKAYSKWLSAVSAKTYRLPSEAEWEHACQAGTTTEFWWGNEISTDQANYDGNYTFGTGKNGEYRQRTVPVDYFEANPWGLYQVHGNVLEWCEFAYDWSSRIVRGGSWNDQPESLRSSYRFRRVPVSRNSIQGFRVVRSLSPSRTF